jgi:hypothetical protein
MCPSSYLWLFDLRLHLTPNTAHKLAQRGVAEKFEIGALVV